MVVVTHEHVCINRWVSNFIYDLTWSANSPKLSFILLIIGANHQTKWPQSIRGWSVNKLTILVGVRLWVRRFANLEYKPYVGSVNRKSEITQISFGSTDLQRMTEWNKFLDVFQYFASHHWWKSTIIARAHRPTKEILPFVIIYGYRSTT